MSKRETWFVADVEADGSCPGLYSMVSFGAVKLDRQLVTTCYGVMSPLRHDQGFSDIRWDPEALKVSGTTREQHLRNPDPSFAMNLFARWIDEHSDGRPVFVSDNLAYDWQFINWYFHKYLGHNPFGYSGRRIGDLWAGMHKDASMSSDWKKLRKTQHTHHPVDDARGNAEALLAMVDLGLKIPGVVL